MADSVRVQRVAEQIRAELSQILRDEVRDPRIRMMTITRVKLASDLDPAYATAFQAASAAGVEMLCYSCKLSPTEIAVERRLEIADLS